MRSPRRPQSQEAGGAVVPRGRSLDGFYDGAGRVLARCGRCQELASPGASPVPRGGGRRARRPRARQLKSALSASARLRSSDPYELVYR